jgi:hypothetical protein
MNCFAVLTLVTMLVAALDQSPMAKVLPAPAAVSCVPVSPE